MTEEKAPALELGRGSSHGSGSGSGTYYKLEVRSWSTMPHGIGDASKPFPFIIDNYWREVPISYGATQWGTNIPIRNWDAEAAKHGLMSYPVAQAHRWAFIAALEAGIAGVGGALCTETRIVAVKYSHSYSTEEVGIAEEMESKTWKRDEEFQPRARLKTA
jgi:hypothetical protein